MMICEGVKIPADGIVVKCNDLCVDESSLTGEAEGVWKINTESAEPTNDYWRKDYCYAGTLVTQGTATVLVDKIGATTEYGKNRFKMLPLLRMKILHFKSKRAALLKSVPELRRFCLRL